MRAERIAQLAVTGVSLDTETHPIQPGLLAPGIVCGSAAWLDAGPVVNGTLLEKQAAIEAFANAIDDPDIILVFANGAFDLAVFAIALAYMGIDAMPSIFKALEDERIFDVLIAEALNAVAGGHLGNDPRTGAPLINPETGKRGRYSLAVVVEQVLGRSDAKANDEWRLRYNELEHIPIAEWPPAARDYPVDDARNTHEVALAQCGHLPKIAYHHEWGNLQREDGTTYSACVQCGATRTSAQCNLRRAHRNLIDHSNQVWTALALHLGATWGFRVNQSTVDVVERHALKQRDTHIGQYIKAGIVREDGSEDQSALKRLVARAYGATEPCPQCEGTGKVPSSVIKTLQCPDCKGRCVPWKSGGKVKDPAVLTCATCNSIGKVPHPNPTMVNCIGSAGVKTCDGTGLRLPAIVPRTDKDGIGKGRDVLHESGDEFLMGYGAYQEDAKDLSTYIPYLRTARVETADGSWLDVPLTLRPNVILETGRVSYNGVIQLFKRQPGHIDRETREWIPSLRECIEARPGQTFSSEDYKAGELYTHAQSCIWITGHSDLGDALLRDVDPHSALAATVLGMTYEEFIARKKEPRCKNARQAAKPFTFGKPGGMGSAKLVLQQRKQGPDTPCPDGPTWIQGDDGEPVRGYKGLRFCILMNGATQCGVYKVSEWGKIGRKRPIPPTCEACLNCAEMLGETWLRQWSENRPYFDFVSRCVDDGMVATKEMLDRWPHLRSVFRVGERTAPGEIIQHVSGRIRGGVEFTSAANGFFQGLLGDVAKAALRRIVRECYDHTVRVPAMAHENSRMSSYGGLESPLLGSRPIGFFHDEVFMEHPDAMAHDGAMRVSEIMTEELCFYCPDVAATAAAEPTLMKSWVKGAEKIIHNGRLAIWTPEHNAKTCPECAA